MKFFKNQKNLFPNKVFPDQIFYSCQVFLNPHKFSRYLELFACTNRKNSYHYIYLLGMLKTYIRETKLFDFLQNTNMLE